jgi:hypothetical protein
MIRVALALAALLLLVLSADLTHTQLRQMPFDARLAGDPSMASGRGAALQGEASSIQANMLLLNEGSQPIQPALSAGAGEEAPAPALLVYFALVLLGSAVSVMLVHHQQRRQT